MKAIHAQLVKRATWHRNNQDDPYNIGNAVQTALTEVANSIKEEMDRVKALAPSTDPKRKPTIIYGPAKLPKTFGQMKPTNRRAGK